MGYYSYKVFEMLQYIEYIKNNCDHDLAEITKIAETGKQINAQNWPTQQDDTRNLCRNCTKKNV